MRKMVPLLDMLNHGGDEKAGMRLDPVATDSARCTSWHYQVRLI